VLVQDIQPSAVYYLCHVKHQQNISSHHITEVAVMNYPATYKHLSGLQHFNLQSIKRLASKKPATGSREPAAPKLVFFRPQKF